MCIYIYREREREGERERERDAYTYRLVQIDMCIEGDFSDSASWTRGFRVSALSWFKLGRRRWGRPGECVDVGRFKPKGFGFLSVGFVWAEGFGLWG